MPLIIDHPKKSGLCFLSSGITFLDRSCQEKIGVKQTRMAHKEFHMVQEYVSPVTTYGLLPFRFMRLDKDSVLLTNDWGEFKIIAPDTFERLHSQAA